MWHGWRKQSGRKIREKRAVYKPEPAKNSQNLRYGTALLGLYRFFASFPKEALYFLNDDGLSAGCDIKYDHLSPDCIV